MDKKVNKIGSTHRGEVLVNRQKKSATLGALCSLRVAQQSWLTACGDWIV